MPKDTDKYRYLQVGLGWDSWVLAQLTRDAEMHQMADQPAKLAAVRLTEYYRLVDLGIIVPGVTVLAKREGSQEIEKTAQEKLTLTKRRSNTPSSSEATVLEESTSVGTNASAALSAFMEDD
jgi:hypothetical protein